MCGAVLTSASAETRLRSSIARVRVCLHQSTLHVTNGAIALPLVLKHKFEMLAFVREGVGARSL